MTSFAHDSAHLAETYDRVSDQQFESGKRLVELLALHEAAHVLDLGCGTGRLTRWISARLGPTARVIGIDPLRRRIDVARAQPSAARFEVGQAEDLRGFEERGFDAVCLSSVLHWIADKPRAFSEIRRVLRPGGRVAATTVARELSAASTLGSILRRLLARAPYAAHVDDTASRGATTTELMGLVAQAGLELLELHVSRTEHEHENGAAFVEFAEASAFGTLLAMVPAGLQPALRTELISALDEHRGAHRLVMRGWGVTLVAQRP